jgi:hypothetical protein
MIAPAQQRLDDAYQVLQDMLVCSEDRDPHRTSYVNLSYRMIGLSNQQEATQSDDEINTTDEFIAAKKVYDEVTADLTTQ